MSQNKNRLLQNTTCLMFTNSYPLTLHVAAGSVLASSEPFAGARSSRCPAMMSWNYAPSGVTGHAKAACTHWHEWIPPCWWFTTPLRPMAVLEVAEREATSLLATQRYRDQTVAVRGCKMERLKMLNLRSSAEFFQPYVWPHACEKFIHDTLSTKCAHMYIISSSVRC